MGIFKYAGGLVDRFRVVKGSWDCESCCEAELRNGFSYRIMISSFIHNVMVSVSGRLPIVDC